MKVFYIVYQNIDGMIVLHFKARKEPSDAAVRAYIMKELGEEDSDAEYCLYGPIDFSRLDIIEE